MNAQTVAPLNTTNDGPVTADALAGMSPDDALVALAVGRLESQRQAAAHRVGLRIENVKTTDVTLAMAKRYSTLAAFEAGVMAAQNAAIADYKAKGGKATKNLAEAAIPDANYRTAVKKIRSAGGKLGWQHVLDSATVGTMYAPIQKVNKEAKEREESGEAKPDTMPVAKPVTTTERMLAELAALVADKPEAEAVAILGAAIAAATRKAGKAKPAA